MSRFVSPNDAFPRKKEDVEKAVRVVKVIKTFDAVSFHEQSSGQRIWGKVKVGAEGKTSKNLRAGDQHVALMFPAGSVTPHVPGTTFSASMNEVPALLSWGEFATSCQIKAV